MVALSKSTCHGHLSILSMTCLSCDLFPIVGTSLPCRCSHRRMRNSSIATLFLPVYHPLGSQPFQVATFHREICNKKEGRFLYVLEILNVKSYNKTFFPLKHSRQLTARYKCTYPLGSPARSPRIDISQL